ncbi:MAG TPA: hypothetical protein VFQ35_10075 [Polyangiaceae bacterium]|nr:hypothetical protein [Polyangiaceae bacterium]
MQLQRGYELKQSGRCADAIPYFVESLRLDRQPKALIHLADCERQIGKYVSAEEHLVAARDLGRELSLDGFVKLAESRLAELESHLPKLTLRLAAGVPGDAVVTRDGVTLAPLSLGVALPVDPGAHEVRVRGGGLERRYSVELRDGESKELQVTTAGGEPVASPKQEPPVVPAVAPSQPPPSNAAAPLAPATQRSSRPDVQRTFGFAVAGAGIIGLGVGSIFGLRTRSKNDDADGMCTTSSPCDAAGRARYDETVEDARHARTISFAAFATGGALLAVGGVLIFTGSARREGALRLAPSVAQNSFGAVAEGVW